jgi:hypothetical protein
VNKAQWFVQKFKSNVVIRLEAIEVGEIMRAWMEDVSVDRLTPDLAKKINEVRRPVRAMLAQRNRKASDAMWDDDYMTARSELLANGLPDWVQTQVVEIRRMARKNQKRMQARGLGNAISTRLMQQGNGTHWGTVK